MNLPDLSGNMNVIGPFSVEACVAEWLTPRTPDLQVRGSSPAHHVVSLDREIYSTLSLFIQVYKWVPATYYWG